MPSPPFRSGTFNIERTCHPSPRLNDRLMLGMSATREFAEWWLAEYKRKYPQFDFELCDHAPAVTCGVPTHY